MVTKIKIRCETLSWVDNPRHDFHEFHWRYEIVIDKTGNDKESLRLTLSNAIDFLYVIDTYKDVIVV